MDIENIKRQIISKYPAFGTLIANIKFENNDKEFFASTDGSKVFYNENNLNNLSNSEQQFVIAHEIFHIAFNHIERTKDKNMVFWNIATDSVINALLSKDGLDQPKNTIDNKDALNYNAEEYYEKIVEEYKKNKEKQKNNKNNKDNKDNNTSGSSENSMNMPNNPNEDLSKSPFDQEKQEDNKSGNEDNSQSNNNDDKTKNEDNNQLDDYDDETKEENNKTNHDRWNSNKNNSNSSNEETSNEEDNNGESTKEKSIIDEIIEGIKNKLAGNKAKKEEEKRQEELKKIQEEFEKLGEKETIKRNRKEKIDRLNDLKEELQKEFNNFNNSNKEGSLDGIGREKIDIENIGKSSNLIDWRRILKNSITRDVDWSYKNATIEYGVVTPHLEEYEIGETEILVDTSGSVDRELLMKFLKECKTIKMSSDIKVGCFDTEFYGFQTIRTMKDIDNLDIQGAGGTDFDVAVNAFTNKVENKIIFTDGEAPMPEKAVDAIWVVYGTEKIHPKGGKVIYISKSDLKRRGL